MSWLIRNWRLVLSGILIIGLSAFAYSKGADSVQRDWDKERLATAKEQAKATKRNLDTINSLEAVKNDNLETIANLRRDVSSIRVRLPAAPCVRHDTASRSEYKTTTTGEQLNQAQSAFDDFTRGLESDANDQDTIMESCRVVIGWAKRGGQ